jgi:S-adenosylmethionine:tRNA ribosyltransferase-isomerase
VGSKPSGGRVEIFLERVRAPGTGREALVQLRASKPIREGLEITTPGGKVRVLGREDELWCVETPMDALEFFEAWGEVPLPPYIHRAADAADRERYQSIFAREKGAVAAPTASLHFDAPLVARLEKMGVSRAFVTLHVGAGTFQPLRTDDLDAHKMHAERVTVSAATWEAIRRTRQAGGRVVAVGTTVVRALESAALQTGGGGALSNAAPRALAGRVLSDGSGSDPVAAQAAPAEAGAERAIAASGPDIFSGETRLFIRPGFTFQAVDAMVTNFHLPESTLLMLVSAFAGRENVLAAYAHAVRQKYRFFSYGDAMFITPMPGVRAPAALAGRSDATGPGAP